MAKKCLGCGAYLDDAANFCAFCGNNTFAPLSELEQADFDAGRMPTPQTVQNVDTKKQGKGKFLWWQILLLILAVALGIAMIIGPIVGGVVTYKIIDKVGDTVVEHVEGLPSVTTPWVEDDFPEETETLPPAEDDMPQEDSDWTPVNP